MKPRLPKGRLPKSVGRIPMVRCDDDMQLTHDNPLSANESKNGVADGYLLLKPLNSRLSPSVSMKTRFGFLSGLRLKKPDSTSGVLSIWAKGYFSSMNSLSGNND